jgi:hypothetical protein
MVHTPAGVSDNLAGLARVQQPFTPIHAQPAESRRRNPMAKAKRSNTAKRRRAKRAEVDATGNPPDHDLIVAACRIAGSFYAYAGALKADPSDDYRYAIAAVQAQYDEARDVLLPTVTRTKATTVAGLLAKARLIPVVAGDDNPAGLLGKKAAKWEQTAETSSVEFYLSFARDVRELLELVPQRESERAFAEVFAAIALLGQGTVAGEAD